MINISLIIISNDLNATVPSGSSSTLGSGLAYKFHKNQLKFNNIHANTKIDKVRNFIKSDCKLNSLSKCIMMDEENNPNLTLIRIGQELLLYLILLWLRLLIQTTTTTTASTADALSIITQLSI